MSSGFMKSDFVWFTGVVEDRADPLFLSRVRVRCFGFHTDDLAKLPTDQLPWAAVMLPTSSSGVSGVGQTPHGLVEGSWVVGFFRDGSEAQDPIVMGSLVGLNVNEALPEKGFYDPNALYPKKNADPIDNYLGESDVHKAARGAASRHILNTEDIRFQKSGGGDTGAKQFTGVVFDEPQSPADPVYPFNHVYESESGHIIEIDDTADKQRIREQHRSGTFYEVHPDGTKVTKIVKDRFELVIGDDYVNVKGQARVVIEGDATTFIKGNYNVEVAGNKTEYVYGNLTQVVKGEVAETYEKSQVVNITKDMTEAIGGAQSTTATGHTSIKNNVAITGLQTVSSTIDAGGIITSNSDVITGSISLKSHVHTSTQTGTPTSSPN